MKPSRTSTFASLTVAASAPGSAIGALNRNVRSAQIFFTLLFLLTGSSAIFAQEQANGEANLRSFLTFRRPPLWVEPTAEPC